MAEEQDITLNIKIDAAASASTVKELRTSLKDLKNQLDQVPHGSEGFKKLTKSINDTEGKLGDLNDSFNTLTGSGVERTTKSFGLLKEGFSTFDAGKIKAGFQGMGAAMSALPIFLLVEGIKLLIENFEVVLEFAKSFTAEAKEQAAAIRDLNQAFGELSANLDEIAFKEKEFGRNLKQANDLAIESAKQRGATEEEINKITLDGKQKTLDLIAKVEENYRKQKAFADSEYLKAQKTGDDKSIEDAKKNLDKADSLYKSSSDKRKDLTNQLELDRAKIQTKSYEDDVAAYKKHLADKEIADKAANAEFARRLQLTVDSKIENEARDKQALADESKAKEDALLADVDATSKAEMLERDNATKHRLWQEGEYEKDAQAHKLAQDKKAAAVKTTLEGTKQALQMTQQLTDMAFAHQLKMAKGNAAKELEIRKKQFNVNKAFGVANSIIDGVGAIQKALNNPYPLNIILAVLTGILATANTVKIATAKFDDGGGSAGGSPDVGSISAPAPVVPSPNNSTTKIKDDGSVEGNEKRLAPPPQKVVLVETDVTASQKRVNVIEESAKFG